MKNPKFVISVFFCLFLVAGCVGKQSASSGPVDPSKAYSGGACHQEGVTQAEYIACLEQVVELLEEGQGLETGSSAQPSANPTTTSSAPPSLPPTTTARPMPPPLSLAYASPAPTTRVVVPVPQVGCSVQEKMLLRVNNPTDYVVEVRGPIAVITCMGDGVIPALVLKKGARGPVQIMVVPPRSKTYFIFTSKGVGPKIQVDFDIYLNMGPEAPAPWIRSFKPPPFKVPMNHRFDMNWQDITDNLINPR